MEKHVHEVSQEVIISDNERGSQKVPLINAG